MPARINPKNPVKIFMREWREHLGATQSGLGARIGENGVDKGTISRWESQDRKPTSDVLAAIAEGLGISVIDLYRLPSDRCSLDALTAGFPRADFDKIVQIIKDMKPPD
jgi:transcriptional regulator with XRE-family HTH domain